MRYSTVKQMVSSTLRKDELPVYSESFHTTSRLCKAIDLSLDKWLCWLGLTRLYLEYISSADSMEFLHGTHTCFSWPGFQQILMNIEFGNIWAKKLFHVAQFSLLIRELSVPEKHSQQRWQIRSNQENMIRNHCFY